MCPQEDFYKNIHSSFICSVQTWKCPRCSCIKKPQQSHTTQEKKKKKKATIYSHNMNKSQKHDGERDDIRTQLYEVLDRPHYHINMQKTATSIPYISAYMWNLEKMVQINLFPRQE